MELVFDPLYNMMLPPADPKCLQIMADQNVFHEGTAAYYDTLQGLIPCKVLEITETGVGFRVGPRNIIKFKLTADRGAYKKGEILTADARLVPPQKMIRKRQYSSTIITTYKYAPKTPA